MIRSVLTILAFIALSGCSQQPPQPEETIVLNYKITGMHCDACANAIQSKLVKVDGIVNADVSYADGSAVVKAHDSAIAAVVLQTIKDMQFGVEQVDELPPPGSAPPADLTQEDAAK